MKIKYPHEYKDADGDWHLDFIDENGRWSSMRFDTKIELMLFKTYHKIFG